MIGDRHSVGNQRCSRNCSCTHTLMSPSHVPRMGGDRQAMHACNHGYSTASCTTLVCLHVPDFHCIDCIAPLTLRVCVAHKPDCRRCACMWTRIACAICTSTWLQVLQVLFNSSVSCRSGLCNANCPGSCCLGCCHTHGALRALYRRTGHTEHTQLRHQQQSLS